MSRIYRHADGGYYIVDNFDTKLKMDDGRWEPGVVYRSVEHKFGRWQHRDRQLFATTTKRWAERFVEVTGETE